MAAVAASASPPCASKTIVHMVDIRLRRWSSSSRFIRSPPGEPIGFQGLAIRNMRSRSHPQYKESSDHGKPDDVRFRESTLESLPRTTPMKHFISRTRPGRSARRRARCLIAERLEDRTLLSTFTVSNTDDHGPGSLRQAIVDANDNANVGGVPDEIDFDIPGSGLQVISPTSGLPPIIDPVVIDGYTQPGSSPNTVVDGDSATLLIVLDGSLDAFADGLQLYAGNSTVRGLVINGFNERYQRVVARGNVIEGNFIGTDATGLLALGNTDAGIDVRRFPGQHDRRFDARGAQRHFGHQGEPIFWVWRRHFRHCFDRQPGAGELHRHRCHRHPESGECAMPASLSASHVGSPDDVASQTTISGNLISGNLEGIAIVGGGNNLVAGNLIGTDVSGTKKLGNVRDGVLHHGYRRQRKRRGCRHHRQQHRRGHDGGGTQRHFRQRAERRCDSRCHGGRQPGAGQLHRHEYLRPDGRGRGPGEHA